MIQSIARKELTRTELDGKEMIINEIRRFDFDNKILAEIEEIFDDWEYAQNHGVFCNEEDEIVMMDVDIVLEELQERIDCNEEYREYEKTIIQYLKDFKGFKIWV